VLTTDVRLANGVPAAVPARSVALVDDPEASMGMTRILHQSIARPPSGGGAILWMLEVRIDAAWG
jgi:hypothetical protein